MNQMNEKKTNLPQERGQCPIAVLAKLENARSLTKLVMLAALALSILFVSTCSSSGGSSSSGSGGSSSSSGGAGSAGTPPAVLMDLAAARVTNSQVTSQVNNVTLSWTQPTDADYSHVNISWLPTGGTTAQPLKVNKDTQTAMIVGLGKATTYAFTAKSVDTDGNESAASAAANVTTTIGRVAMFTLGTAAGDFGFDACQNALDGNAATMNTGTGFTDAERAMQNAIGTHMKGLGYSKAVFFGSRGGAIAASSDSGAPAYDFVNIDTDADALAVAGQDEAASGARELSVFTAGADTDNTITETTVFGAVSAAQASLEPRTLANVLGISSTGVASAEGGQVLNGLIPTAVLFWTLTTSAGTYSTNNCTHATVTTGMGASDIYNNDSELYTIGGGAGTCDSTLRIFCIAH